MTWTYNLVFQLQASYGHAPHTQQNLKFKGQSVEKIGWKQTDRQTDERKDATGCFTYSANAADNKMSP